MAICRKQYLIDLEFIQSSKMEYIFKIKQCKRDSLGGELCLHISGMLFSGDYIPKVDIMLHKNILSVWLTTIYLVVYCVFLQFQNTEIIGRMMFLFSPILVCWMIYTLLKQGKYNGPELGDEEFGYQDKAKNELGVF